MILEIPEARQPQTCLTFWLPETLVSLQPARAVSGLALFMESCLSWWRQQERWRWRLELELIHLFRCRLSFATTQLLLRANLVGSYDRLDEPKSVFDGRWRTSISLCYHHQPQAQLKGSCCSHHRWCRYNSILSNNNWPPRAVIVGRNKARSSTALFTRFDVRNNPWIVSKALFSR